MVLSSIIETTRSYEKWLSAFMPLLPADLKRKHEAMASGAFPFLRATYYRWAQVCPRVFGKWAGGPSVLAVGDLHIENFGTWRDAEGRLAWGVNDFDEASVLPYTGDLIRLATSALIAIEDEKLGIPAREACGAILDGYRRFIDRKGRPFVLAEDHTWLREIAAAALRDPARFWSKLEALPTFRGRIPAPARSALTDLLPSPAPPFRLVHRVAGLGSLGRPRIAAIAPFQGGLIAREAKALAPSACAFALGAREGLKVRYAEILSRSVRCADPFLRLRGSKPSNSWVVRRLAPDCSRVELESIKSSSQRVRMLTAMGMETANIHLGTPRRASILRDLRGRGPNWLLNAAQSMYAATLEDWRAWRTRR